MRLHSSRLLYLTTLLCSHLSTLSNAQEYSIQTIYQGPPGLWLENLRMRSNGSLLVTELDRPRLLQFDPHSGQGPLLVHDFPGYLGLTGITETYPDVFAVVTGNFSLKTLDAGAGSWSVWTVDYRLESCDKDGAPAISKLADVLESGLFNGITYQPASNALFIADSELGVIFKMDSSTGQYSVAINNTLTNKANSSVLEGCNGIKYYDSSLYWTNSNAGYLAKAPLNSAGDVVGNGMVVIDPDVNMDDFAFAADGTAYLAGGFINQIFRLRPDGSYVSIAGSLNSSEVAEPTAMTFSGTSGDMTKNLFYVTTGGALGDPINGTTVIGGQLLAVSF